MANEYTNPYKALIALGAPTDSRESDLYVISTEETRAIIKASGWYHSEFRSAIDGRAWIEIPFAYEPFWDKRARTVSHTQQTE